MFNEFEISSIQNGKKERAHTHQDILHTIGSVFKWVYVSSNAERKNNSKIKTLTAKSSAIWVCMLACVLSTTCFLVCKLVTIYANMTHNNNKPQQQSINIYSRNMEYEIRFVQNATFWNDIDVAAHRVPNAFCRLFFLQNACQNAPITSIRTMGKISQLFLYSLMHFSSFKMRTVILWPCLICACFPHCFCCFAYCEQTFLVPMLNISRIDRFLFSNRM